MPLLELNNIGKTFYINKKIKKKALSEITLHFQNTGLISVVGPSGCGKSTLLNLIGKIDNPSEGKLIFNQKNITKLSELEAAEYRRKNVGYVFQHYHLLEKHNVIQLNVTSIIKWMVLNKAKKKPSVATFGINKDLLTKQCSGCPVARSNVSPL